MKKIKTFLITIIIMLIASTLSLLVVSALTYFYKWQADKALIGITLTYILAGFSGGLFLKIKSKGQLSMTWKMLEACLLSTIFMGILIVISVFVIKIPFAISSRFLMICMLFLGSTCLGRIL